MFNKILIDNCIGHKFELKDSKNAKMTGQSLNAVQYAMHLYYMCVKGARRKRPRTAEGRPHITGFKQVSRRDDGGQWDL